MPVEPQRHYDLSTAVTFFLAGLGVGSLFALIFSPRFGFLIDLADGEATPNRKRVPAL